MQVKKPEIRDAILGSAFELFSGKGYAGTTVPQIATRAGISTTNLYIYFESKLAILYAIYGPWIQREFEALEIEIRSISKPRAKLRRLFTVLFRELPARQGGFANNIIQAIASARTEGGYRPSLMVWLEERLLDMLANALPGVPRKTLDKVQLAHFMLMAFDGHIVFHQVGPDRSCSDATITFLCDLFEGTVGAAKPLSTAKRRLKPLPT